MRFEKKLLPDEALMRHALGYGSTPPDEAVQTQLLCAQSRMAEAAEPRWTAARYALLAAPLFKKEVPPPEKENDPAGQQMEGTVLQGADWEMPGHDIALHLAGCEACILLAVTLGTGIEEMIRSAEATDMQQAVLLDTAASALVEQYADAAEEKLRARLRQAGEFLTTRFSPGYGDLPLAVQREVVRLLDGPRAIGLTVSESGILLPRKSITAVLGVAKHPVTGRLAGCESCALHGKCTLEKEGRTCGKITSA